MNKKILVTTLALLATGTASAGVGPAWAWDAGKLPNGRVQLKSSNGASTYDVQQNPVGAVAKVNQSALTQPPTVIVQATSGLPFTYKEDCWHIVTSAGVRMLVVGVKSVDNRFNGLAGVFVAADHGRLTGGSAIQAILSPLMGGTGGAGHKTNMCVGVSFDDCVLGMGGDEVMMLSNYLPQSYRPCYYTGFDGYMW